MNRNENNNRCNSRILHHRSFTGVHPPGGLVTWPDGTTSRIGERRLATTRNGRVERMGFVAWPQEEREGLRA